jgi:hypothetical protein
MVHSAARRGGHFSDEAWLDFARNQAGEAQEAMARHLAAPCLRCAEVLRLWHAVADYAPALPAYLPPEGAVRTVKAAFAALRPAPAPSRAARAAALVFDSLRQPALAGVRASGASPRQMLYRFGPYLVRISLEKAPGADHFVLMGQVLDESTPGRRLADVPVLAFHGQQPVERTLTNDMGEFVMEPEAADDLRLSVGVPDAAPLNLPLLAKPRTAQAPGVLGTRGAKTHTRRPGDPGPRR